MRTIQGFCLSRLLYLSFLIGLLVFQPSIGSAEDGAQSVANPSEQVTSLMAGLSDEQVRQMLIAELQKDPQAELYSEQQKMVGPAGIFHRILRKLSAEHDDNEGQLRKLRSGIPNLLPDLHKVFLTL